MDMRQVLEELEEVIDLLEDVPPEAEPALEEIENLANQVQDTFGIELESDTPQGLYEEIGELLEDETLQPAQREYLEGIGSAIRRAAGHVARAYGRASGTVDRAKSKARRRVGGIRRGISNFKKAIKSGYRKGYHQAYHPHGGGTKTPKRVAGAKARRRPGIKRKRAPSVHPAHRPGIRKSPRKWQGRWRKGRAK